jgi:far upstream element-binding protein
MRPGGLPGEGGDRGYGGGYGGSDAGGGGGGYAAPPADKPLWETHKSPEGYTYYYNTTTGETQWDMPDDFPGVAPP